MTHHDVKEDQELSVDELESQDVAELPNREAMSLISPSPIPIGAVGPGEELPVQPPELADNSGGGVEFLGPPEQA